MNSELVNTLVAAIEKRCCESSSEVKYVAGDFELVRFGELDEKRPAGLKRLLSLNRAGKHSALIAIVTLEHHHNLELFYFELKRQIDGIANYLIPRISPIELAAETYLWAIGPCEVRESEGWMNLRSDVYQDTWSVQKSLWLPADGTLADASEFLDEGFLAVPWKLGESDATEIDLIERFAAALAGQGVEWTQDHVHEFMGFLEEDELSDSSFAELCQFLEKR